MTMRRKTLVIVTTTFLCMVVIINLITHYILLRNYTNVPSEVYWQVQYIVAYIILSVVVFGLVFGVLTVFLLEKEFLSRFIRLNKDIEGIIKDRSLVRQVSTPGKDELSSLESSVTNIATALGHSQDKLRESEQHYRLLAENAQDVIWTVDMNNRPTFISPSIYSLLGYSVQEAMSKPMEEIFTPASYELALKTFAEELAIEKMDKKNLARATLLELELRRKNGSLAPIEVKFTSIRDTNDRPVEILAIARDISERKRVEEALRNSEEKLRRTFESVADGIVVSNLNGIITEVNERLLEMLGFSSRNVVLGKHHSEFIPQRDREEVKTRMHKMLKDGVDRRMETPIVRVDGSEFLGEITSSLLKDASGSPIGFVTVINDITERQQSQQKLEELYEHEKDLRQKLESEIKRRIEFTRALVHELKTPITSVLASSELLAGELKEEPWLSLARNINRSANNLDVRIDELLDLAKSEIGVLRLNYQPVDTIHLIQDIIESMSAVASSNQQTLSFEQPASLPIVWADQDRLRQILLNLVNNALKFTPAGGKITLRSKKEGTSLIIEVQDTGRGLTEEEQQRLFQPYHRLEDDRELLSGLGLGLALSKNLVELHGGKIWLKSQKGKGSTFGFSVPLEAARRSD